MDLLFDWPESLMLFVGVLALIGSLFISSLFVLYTVCFLVGFIFGRLWFKQKQKNKIPLFLVLVGVFLGLIMGSLSSNSRLLLLALVGGTLAGYWVKKKSWLEG